MLHFRGAVLSHEMYFGLGLFFPFRHCVGKASKSILSPLRSVLFFLGILCKFFAEFGTMTKLESEQWQQNTGTSNKAVSSFGLFGRESETPCDR